jgi:peptidoglycan/LPS O-acetylase OafA/YrhL
MPPKHILELTSLRAFAALFIVLFHSIYNERENSTLWAHFVADGHLGVDLFFILSGFILTHVYLQQEFRTGQFLLNRIARIYPLHLFMLVMFVIAYQVLSAVGVKSAVVGKDWSVFHWHVLLLHAWGFTKQHAWNFPSWSVSAEFFAYLIFPLLLRVLRRTPRVAGFVGSVGLFLGLVTIAAAFGFHLTKLMYNFGIVRIFGEFAMGMALYRIFEVYRPAPIATYSILAGACATILIVAGGEFPEPISVLAMTGLIYSLACLSTYPHWNPLRARPLVYLGEISYSTYMVHLLVIMGARRIIPASWQIPVIFLVTYCASAMLYHFVEVPGRKRLRDVFGAA